MSQQATDVGDSGKGKMRAKEVVGLPAQPPEPLSYLRPSLDVACQTASEYWPARISPKPIVLPPTTRYHHDSEITLSAPSVQELGNLVFSLFNWMDDGVFDIGRADLGFNPPPGTTITGQREGFLLPTGLHLLRAEQTYYSV